jgi:hypothetical protein
MVLNNVTALRVAIEDTVMAVEVGVEDRSQ